VIKKNFQKRNIYKQNKNIYNYGGPLTCIRLQNKHTKDKYLHEPLTNQKATAKKPLQNLANSDYNNPWQIPWQTTEIKNQQ